MSAFRRSPWSRSLLSIVLSASTLLAVGLPADAFAKKDKKPEKLHVELTGVDSLDKVFKPLKKLDQRITKAEKARKTGKDSLNAALGLKKGTSLPAAVSHLKSEAAGKVKVKLQGGTPTLEAADALPPNIREGVEAANVLIKSYIEATKELAGAPAEAAKLVKEAKKLPDTLKKELTSDPLKSITIIRNLGVVKDNIKVASGLPKRTTTLTKNLNKDVKVIVTAFGGTWPPIPGR